MIFAVRSTFLTRCQRKKRDYCSAGVIRCPTNNNFARSPFSWAVKSPVVAMTMDNLPLADQKVFSTTMVSNVNDLPATSPHGSDLGHRPKFLDLYQI